MHGHGRKGNEETGRRQVGWPLRGGIGNRVWDEDPLAAGGAGPEAYPEPRAALARSRMKTQPLRRSIEQRTDPRVPATFPGAPAPSSQESGAKMLTPQKMRPLLPLPAPQ